MVPLLAAAAGLTAVGVAFALPTAGTTSHAAINYREPASYPEPPIVEPEITAQAATNERVRSPSDSIALVFAVGKHSYMKLADVSADAMPKHGKPKLYHHEYIEASIANVDPADTPYREWLGRKVMVDSKCEATVTGFAIVSRLTGDTGYSDVDADKWTARNVLEHGAGVLAAELDGCKGTFARAAELPPVIVPTVIEDDALVAKARAAVLDSNAALATQTEWREFDQEGNWWDADFAHFESKVVRHPTTGVTWVSLHAYVEHGCGDATANVWGLFRADADGTFVPVQLRRLDDLWSIDQLIDTDGDGEPEVIGTPWLGLDTVVATGSGVELDRLPLAFFGCPC